MSKAFYNRKPFTHHSIQHKIVKSITTYQIKFSLKLLQFEHLFWLKSSRVQLQNAVILLLWDWINCCRDISKLLSMTVYASIVLSILLMHIINLGHWLLHFKILSFIIILKLNKALYNISKIFQPIILLFIPVNWVD